MFKCCGAAKNRCNLKTLNTSNILVGTKILLCVLLSPRTNPINWVNLGFQKLNAGGMLARVGAWLREFQGLRDFQGRQEY